ncbi:MAG TPA: hypothetical protein VK658_04525 [Chryseolinea sp.]|nr:hypothetical protein [Chryseolinea sp.]
MNDPTEKSHVADVLAGAFEMTPEIEGRMLLFEAAQYSQFNEIAMTPAVTLRAEACLNYLDEDE